ncbi:MAG: hypothetical protein Q8K32_11070 [Archangium sp.]|nr:hypothetical protein [Archangium sp.]
MPEAIAPVVAPPANTAPAKPVIPSKPAPAAKAPTEAADGKAPAETEGDDVDPKDLWKKATKGRTFKHKGAEKSLEELDPDEAAEYIRRGYGASEMVAEAKKTQSEASKILDLKKAIAEGDDDAALEAIMEIGGKRGLQLLDKLRQSMAAQEEEDAGLTDKERAAMQRAQAAEQKAAELERAEQKRAQEEEQKQYQREEVQTKTEALGKVSELMKLIKGFPPEKKDLLGPYVARAWREAIETGAELGKDVSPEAIIKRAEKLFRGSTSDFYGKLSPTEQFEFLGEEAVAKLSAELVRRRRGGATAAKPVPPAPKKTDTGREAPELGDPRYLMR